MNFRAEAILLALNHVSSNYRDEEPLNIVEVGCMFKEDEGFSTYLISDFLAKRARRGRFVSIDYDLSHIDASRVLIQKWNSSLSDFIEYRHGHSLSILPEVLKDLDQVHFFYLDGGAHPEVCLSEFEHAMVHLAPYGVILVDDAQQMHPSKNYQLPRPLGKATLILPMLIIANYLLNREAMRTAKETPGNQKSTPKSRFVGQMENIDIPCLNAWEFEVIGSGHQILAYGSPNFLAEANKLSEAAKLADIGLRSLITAVKRKIGRFVS